MEFSHKDQRTLIAAVAGALQIIRENIGGYLPDDPEVKDNETLVTKIDHEVQNHIVPLLHDAFPEVRIISEEGVEIGESETVLLLDPLDGTRAFSCGLATSTIIVGIYDSAKKEVVGCVVGEASMGRVWSAFGDKPALLDSNREVHVWPGKLDEQSTLFLDVPHGFTRNGRTISTHEGMARLFYLLRGRKLAIPGSNGLIQALVANGGQKVAGSITTAIGGPWDVCGVKLVLNAGGFARSFSVHPWDGDRRGIDESNPLDVMSYDVLVTGNSKAVVDFLSDALSFAYTLT